jgi:hypothetical protein
VAEPAQTRLEAELRALGRQLDMPPAPDVWNAVHRGLTSADGLRRHPRRRGRRLIVAVLAALTTTAVLGATPQGRAAVAELLQFAGVTVRQGQGDPAGPANPSGAGRLPDASATALDDARSAAPFPVRTLAALGPPDQVIVADGRPPRVVSLVYRAAPNRPPAGGDGVAARLDQFDGTAQPVFEKIADPGSTEVVQVAGRRALWVRGPHELLYIDRSGQIHAASARLAANTLIWEIDGVTLRLEGAFSRDEAIRVAESAG